KPRYASQNSQDAVGRRLTENKHLLLPDAIVLEAMGNDAEDRLRETANATGIPLEIGHTIPAMQVGLFLLASSLEEYQQHLTAVEGEEFLNSRFIYGIFELPWNQFSRSLNLHDKGT
ncbi:MAG TPA: hypothetical protein PLZ25_07675, partial [Flavobacteriales bacterium]|nr:hypothetical protein [Flavobacteriales bacterium]